MYTITAIPALQDNYIWAIHNDNEVVIVDPGVAHPVLAFLADKNLTLTGILCTHRHHDHIGGIAELRAVYNVPVYGRQHERNPYISHDLREGEKIKLNAFNLTFHIMEIPGHLDDHIAFYEASTPLLFCGDVLFGAGCGRNFEGSLNQLHDSLQRLSKLPDATLIYCAHEYTAANLRFALACEPGNTDIQQRNATAIQWRALNRPSLPSTIALEKATNPFVRCSETTIIQTLQSRGLTNTSQLAVFTALREWKNNF
ncbi:MAG: hydroxyacylglutathione hydrolase [Gallionella sp.]